MEMAVLRGYMRVVPESTNFSLRQREEREKDRTWVTLRWQFH
jgi:hypothetical protein